MENRPSGDGTADGPPAMDTAEAPEPAAPADGTGAAGPPDTPEATAAPSDGRLAGAAVTDRLAVRIRDPAGLARGVARALVLTPGRSAAVVLTVAPYLWLTWYVLGTALGVVGDPVIGGDWLTLGFTAYAFVFPLALAHRTLQIGLDELTQEYLVDVVVLVWLTAFYLVWMLAREPVDPRTSMSEVVGPLAAGQPMAVQWGAVAGAVAVLVVGLSADRNEESALFRSPFRTALVTVPGLVTVLVLTTAPGPESWLWPVLGGAFAGTVLAGVRHLPTVASGLARAAFVCLAAVVWAVGAALWVGVTREPPPTRTLLLGHVDFGLREAADTSDSPAGAVSDDARAKAEGDETPAASPEPRAETVATDGGRHGDGESRGDGA
jgi:hypothetical protein